MNEEFLEKLQNNRKEIEIINRDDLMKLWAYFKKMQIDLTILDENVNKNTKYYTTDLIKSESIGFKNQIIEIYLQNEISINKTIALTQLINLMPNTTTLPESIKSTLSRIYAEDITKTKLPQSEDYLFYLKNIVRILNLAIGNNIIGNTFFNNLTFEVEFNKITKKNKQILFYINTIYQMEIEKKFNKNINNNDTLKKYKEQLLELIKPIIINSKIETKLQKQLDEQFISDLNLRNEQYYYYIHGTSSEDKEHLEEVFNYGLKINGTPGEYIQSIITPILEQDIYEKSLTNIIKNYHSSNIKNIYLIAIPKDFLKSNVENFPMPMWKSGNQQFNYFTPHLINGMYSITLDEFIKNPNYGPNYDPNGLQFSKEQFEKFTKYDNQELIKEYKKRTTSSYYNQYQEDKKNNQFQETITYYENKYKTATPQTFDSGNYEEKIKQNLYNRIKNPK